MRKHIQKTLERFEQAALNAGYFRSEGTQEEEIRHEIEFDEAKAALIKQINKLEKEIRKYKPVIVVD